MVSTFPAKKNAAFKAVFPILDADGDLVTGAAELDSEVSKDGGTFADCTNEASEIATSSGMYALDLTATEMNADVVAVIVKTTTSGAKTTVLVFYTAAQTLDEIAGATFATGTDSLEKIHDDHVTHLSAAPSTHDAAAVWAVATRALTDKAGFTISGTKQTLDALNDITAASVWAVATRALTDKAGFSLAADQSGVTIGTVNSVGDKTGYALSATGIDAIIDDVIEGTLTLRQAIRIYLAALGGKSTGGGTNTITFLDNAGSKARITATVDADGNRTAMTLDGT